MKKHVLLIFIILSSLPACTYNGKILIPDDISATAYERGKYNLKAAIIVTQYQKNETVRLSGGGYRFNLTPYPNLYKLMQEKMKSIFSETDIVEEKDVQRGKYDVYISTRSNINFNALNSSFELSLYTKGFDIKGNEIFSFASRRNEPYSEPIGELIGAFISGLTLCLACPITIPLMTYSVGSSAEETITAIVKTSLDETVDSMTSSPALRIYAKDSHNEKLKDIVRLSDNGSAVYTPRPAPIEAPIENIQDIPHFKSQAKKDDIAVVIGIEHYQSLPSADYSRSDAGIVKDYLKALGFQERNVEFLTDERATKSGIEKTIEAWLPNRVKKDSRVFVYYSGHGAPDPASGEANLVPYDGDPNYLAVTGYPINRLYDKLGKLDAKEVVIVLDACFSGAGGRSILAKGTRPIVIVAEGAVLHQNMAVLSATQGTQISTSSPEKGHGLLTYYFLKAIKDGKSDLAEIYEQIKPQIEDEAKALNVQQSPSLMPNADSAKGKFSLRN